MGSRIERSKFRLTILMAALAFSGCYTKLNSTDERPAGADGGQDVHGLGMPDVPGVAIDGLVPDSPIDGPGTSGVDSAVPKDTGGSITTIDAPVDSFVAPECPAKQHMCGGVCVSDDDSSSCGNACTACPIPQGGSATCDGTSCGGTCPEEKTLCNGVCIAKDTACSGSCPGETHPCKGLCLSSSDVTGCGPSCTVCPVPTGASRATCDGTKCGFVCNAGYHVCGNTCARDDSPSACGSSCTVCPLDPNGVAICLAGICSVTCTPGYHYCSEVKKCLKDTDAASCGTSCTPCPSITGGTASCTAGVCGGDCPGTQKLCNGACIEASASCSGQCPPGTHNCSGVCASDTSPNSCGTSCTACLSPEGSDSATCTGGTCEFTCTSGRHKCGDRCPANDDANACGSSCTKCQTDPNGIAICQNGTCAVRCNSGYHNCAGTCVSNNALATCGLTECSTACQAPVGGSVTCNGTACVPACPASLPQNCNGTCLAANAACNGTCLNGQKYCASSGTCIAIGACCGDSDCPSGSNQTCNANHQCVCPGNKPVDCGGVCIATCPGTKTCDTAAHECRCPANTTDCGGACITPCTNPKTCNPSSQQCACPANTTDCGGACIAPCSGGMTCNPADQRCECPNGTKDCNGTCISISDCCSNADCNNGTTGMTCNASRRCVCSGSAPPQPTLNNDASALAVCRGETARISVLPNGGYTYKWYKSGSTVPLTDGALYSGTTTPTLSLLNTTTATGNSTYYCEISSASASCAGSTASDSFRPTINLPPTLDTSNFSDVSCVAGEYGWLYWTVGASSPTSFDFSYDWTQNGGAPQPGVIQDNGTRVQTNKGCSVAGQWQVAVTDLNNGCVARANATVTVSCPSGGTCSPASACP